MNTAVRTTIDPETLDALVGRAVNDLSAGYGGVMISIGHSLGLYKSMHQQGPLTADDVAKRSGCEPRYVREWLNSQVAGEYIDYQPLPQTYELTPEGSAVLADENSPTFMPFAWQIPASLWLDEAKIAKSIRSGDGLPWGEHNDRLFCGVASFFRNSYQASLLSDWLPALTGVVEKLQRGASVADIGCGFGHSTLLMAKAYPNSRFVGVDNHAHSIEAAKQLASEQGLGGHVHFQNADASLNNAELFDLVCLFDCLHDMGQPQGALRSIAQSLKPDGSLLLVEPFAGDALEQNINPVARMYYSASTAICCAHAISEQRNCSSHSDVLGAQAGEHSLAPLLEQAGFKSFKRVAETPFNLVFEARL